ncbi:MAG: AAA family ATPase [Alphaproteobacteria bacterium]|nr:AAA family ATPase [Alphaproteobacteria bacterium]
MTVSALSYDQLYSKCDLDFLSFETTRDLEDLNQPLGQEQAINAINFGISMDSYGYNLFCIGSEGTGKSSLVRQILTKAAKKRRTPDDWCYVYNFKTPYKPSAVRMSAGKAKIFAKAVDKLIEEIRVALPAVFDGEEYKVQLKAIEDAFRDQKTQYFDEIQKHTTGKNVSVLRMPVGLVVAPTKDGDVLSPEAFEKLPEEEQQEVLAELNAAQEELENAVHDIPKWEKEQREQIQELNEQFASLAIKHLIDGLKRKYRHNKSVTAFLRNMYADIIENVDMFLEDDSEQPPAQMPTDEEQAMPLLAKQKSDGFFRRYKVNVLIDHSERTGAPLIFLDHPILTNLIGRIDRQQQYGALITDFNMIKAGALHEANGGFLVIEAKDLLNQSSSWEALKRALRSKKITMDPPSADGMMTTILEPEAIPLNVKIVLLGEPELYYMLAENDPDFTELFKVEANFFPYMEKTQENISKYARLIATQARRNQLRPLKKEAVARLLEHASRLAEDSQKLTAHIASISDLIREANYCAMANGKSPVITCAHVDQAITAKIKRSDRIQERMTEQIMRGSVLIDTDGAVVGQINGLAVLEFGQLSFGKPSRITCLARMGSGEIIDIEREVDLGGPLHTKGVLILSSFLASRFSQNAPLSMEATLVFEQSYGEVDGDSASSTELYAMLSALSNVPIRQNLAVTGSVNQFGQIQAIGGVNEKIEGFFDICRLRGLTGTQGVLIPKTNVVNLMLRQDVVEACKEGKFHIYPVSTIDEGIEILTGLPAGKRSADGSYPADSVNGKVQERLNQFLAQNLEYRRQTHLPPKNKI